MHLWSLKIIKINSDVHLLFMQILKVYYKKKDYNTEIRHMHKTYSYMFNVVSVFDEYKFEPKIFRGENAIKNFLHVLL